MNVEDVSSLQRSNENSDCTISRPQKLCCSYNSDYSSPRSSGSIIQRINTRNALIVKLTNQILESYIVFFSEQLIIGRIYSVYSSWDTSNNSLLNNLATKSSSFERPDPDVNDFYTNEASRLTSMMNFVNEKTPKQFSTNDSIRLIDKINTDWLVVKKTSDYSDLKRNELYFVPTVILINNRVLGDIISSLSDLFYNMYI